MSHEIACVFLAFAPGAMPKEDEHGLMQTSDGHGSLQCFDVICLTRNKLQYREAFGCWVVRAIGRTKRLSEVFLLTRHMSLQDLPLQAKKS